MSLPFLSRTLRTGCLAILAIAATFNAFAGESKIIDINGDFEQLDSGMPERWGGVGGVGITEEVSKSPSHSLAVPFPVDPKLSASIGERKIDSGNFKAGDEVEISVSAFLKSDLGASELIGGGFEIWDPNGVRKLGVPIKFDELPGQWQTFSASVNIPEGFDENWKVAIKLIAKRGVPGTVENTVYFDDVSVTVRSQ